ncbi:MAG: hypothetical protein WDO18_12595 [Acidobacteriota bacterium]
MGTFNATAGLVTTDQAAVITASYDGKQATATIRLKGDQTQPSIESFSCTATISSGTTGLCTVTFTNRIVTAEA